MLDARLLLGITLLSVGCPSTPVEPPPPDPVADPTLPAGPGEARAAVLPTDDDAFAASTWAGITAEARPGDFKLWNDRVRFVVRAEDGHGYVGIAGALIDADLVRPTDELGRDTLEEAFTAFGLGRLAGADSIRVVSDGLDGSDAIVRVEGTDIPFQFLMGVVESEDPLTPALGLRVVTDYVLPPDSFALTVRTTLYNETDVEVRTNPLDGLIASGEDLWSFATGEGLAPGVEEEPAAIGTVGRQREAAFALFLPDGPLDRFGASDLLAGSGVSLASHGWFDIPAGQSVEIVRHRALGPDTLSIEAVRNDLQGGELVGVSGTVTAGGEPVDGARVHLVDGDVVRGFAWTDAAGAWSARVPAGAWTVWVTALGQDELIPLPGGAHRYAPFAHPGVNGRQLGALDGTAPRTPAAVARGMLPVTGTLEALEGATIDLELVPPRLLELTVTDEAAAPLAAMAEVRTANPWDLGMDEPLREALGLPSPSTRVLRGWTPSGSIALPLPAGDYEVIVEGGPRRERVAVPVSLDDHAQVPVTLATVVPRDGWLSMDSHLHAAPSNDGELPMEHRLIACAAAGIDIPVTTDHDRNADYRPLVDALGLAERMTVVPGVEVSPPLRGHFNLFPTAPQGPSVVNGGAPAWWLGVEDTDALMALMHEEDGAIIQVNHGRDGASGAMNAAGFDPSVAEPFRPDFWSWDFEMFELVNARGAGNWIEPRADWFSWLNTGQIKVPTGVSDSHGLGAVCGYGRTDVFLDTTDPSDVDPGALREAVLAGRVVVSGGPTLRVAAGNAGPGDTVVGTEISLAITVRAPDWIVPQVVRVYRNGALLEEQAIAGPAVDGLWWEGTVTDAPDVDSWYAVEVEGAQPLGAFWGGAIPYAMANAIFVDRDGDGWTAPGLP